MINKLWTKLKELINNNTVVETPQKPELKDEEMGDHIVLCITPDTNEPYIKIVIQDDNDPNRMVAFADMIDSLNAGLYFSSMLATLKDIAINSPPVKDKVMTIIATWEELHKARHNRSINKNTPVVRPTDFSKRE
jgi:hypothetical protein